MTKQLLPYVMCVGMLMSAPAISAAQTREAESQITVQGTVEAVDHTGRTVTIRLNSSGKVVTLDVPTKAMRFEQVKVGDPDHGHLLRSGQPPVEARGRAARSTGRSNRRRRRPPGLCRARREPGSGWPP